MVKLEYFDRLETKWGNCDKSLTDAGVDPEDSVHPVALVELPEVGSGSITGTFCPDLCTEDPHHGLPA